MTGRQIDFGHAALWLLVAVMIAAFVCTVGVIAMSTLSAAEVTP